MLKLIGDELSTASSMEIASRSAKVGYASEEGVRKGQDCSDLGVGYEDFGGVWWA